MYASAELIGTEHYVYFTIGILALLAIDLGLINRKEHPLEFRRSLFWTSFWIALAFGFVLYAIPAPFNKEVDEDLRISFITGYILEYSLSMDNVFVIALIFTYFKVPISHQHRVLFWGIIGALLLRGIMIGLGSVVVKEFHWMLYIFGAFLAFSGFKMLFMQEEGVDPEKNPLVRIARKFLPISLNYDGEKFRTIENGVTKWTPLIVVLIAVETADVIFAVDSIPAIYSVTQEPYIIFTSNICAILGLRSLYFVLIASIQYFRYLKIGMSVVLILIGLKMLLLPSLLQLLGWHPPNYKKLEGIYSLVAIAGILLLSMIFSVVMTRKKPKTLFEDT